ncbi:probable LRR receptor-like serine/threonine-protein kinase RFK1 isoform X1 [Juglans microcarpa x Juglans regia]|uniref:probable LRR receptor-like serine/threonine-protein kinase RFK1 isoform X1 n=3 Tax=Juglans microcarpa x Juglans regia TaxID=2249226 RepID=UPI001B7E6E5D|nr:probable LRR receptor-like serine/threonine-protein kinase RFK1 isoform X1 [Juglans microcarpa x Juglans regia]XP_041023583.1 probable LRR receptor-like serine/threonine-protein kinase RFK1 isoform X1 [Juglans microcarpa x Juglans regia]XP_041023584.1 probable LRR receptor-like serine/threonine-protein kinase RFK1 isoform X1 [Juglans microcarpa x Juglans regia]
MLAKNLFGFMIFASSCFRLLGFAEARVPQEEVDALQQITSTMGAMYWKFNGNSCEVEMVGIAPEPPRNSESSIDCDCHFENNTVCHVVTIMLKGFSLSGMLPPQLVKLRYLQKIDFAYNYLNGMIPLEWTSMQLNFISVLANRLSGEIPKELGNITTLKYMCLEANRFSGIVPPELGNLINLQTLVLSSNNLTGNLPKTFSRLQNLTDFRINDNNFKGKLPDFIQNWKQLTRLEMHASGLEGPIPPKISLLYNLAELRISDMDGPNQDFPMLRNMSGIVRLVLRNCKISGEIPAYIWTMKNLEMLDVSFNKLIGEIPTSANFERLKFLFLTGNSLRGNVPESILKAGSNIDLSYNNFTWQGPEQPACGENLNLNLNLFQSSLKEDNIKQGPHCLKNFNCPRYSNCLHINSGGNNVAIKEDKVTVVYEGDADVEGGAAEYFIRDNSYWGFSSTGDFMDDNNYQNTRYTLHLSSANISELYATARVSPMSLTYFHYCLENGNYTVNLHFAEIVFTNDKTYNSLGKRVFDIYVQEILVVKDFNVEDYTGVAQKAVVKPISNVIVSNNILEIRFYWAGKGTTRIPDRGVYGPLISAVSVVSDFKLCRNGGTNRTVYIIVGVAIGALCLLLFLGGILWWKGCLLRKRRGKKDTRRLDSVTGTFSLKQIKAATNDFDCANKIGEGGFGPVYKGQLPDGTVIAVKQLSSKSKQGNREFLNEMGMISCLQHPNLVNLHGCCIEGDQLLLVYEYLENNSLAGALFENSQLKLDWPTRLKICIGIARGLAFLHEESRLKIVHRDIKATNVLLDGELNPKISDFGLARLDEEEKTHITTRIAGTIGYMAPEYALWGHLTYKADVYSFGVLALEIFSGKNNNNYMPSDNCVCLLDRACHLQQTGKLMKLIDERLESGVDEKEAEIMVKAALLCTNASASLRPTMSEVVSMLEGRLSVPDQIPEASTYHEDLRFKAMRDLHKDRQNQSSSGSQTHNSTAAHTFCSTSTFGHDLGDIKPDSESCGEV